MQLRALHTIGIRRDELVAPGALFEIEDRAEAQRLITSGAAARLEESVLEAPPAERSRSKRQPAKALLAAPDEAAEQPLSADLSLD